MAPTPWSVDDWIEHLCGHRETFALAVRAVDGTTVLHNAEARMPAASAIKLVHLVAIARAVAGGTLSLAKTVSVSDWEEWYVPLLDGGAHSRALHHLGVGDRDGAAADLTQRVSVSDLVEVMIRFSDSAAPDLLRTIVGDVALRKVLDHYDLPSPLPYFRDMYRRIAAAGAVDADQSQAPPYATAEGLTRLISDIAGVGFPGARLARDVLEWQGPDSAGGILGFKGGRLPGVRAECFAYRPPEGPAAVGTLLIRDVPAAAEGFAHQQLLLQALLHPEVMRALL